MAFDEGIGPQRRRPTYGVGEGWLHGVENSIFHSCGVGWTSSSSRKEGNLILLHMVVLLTVIGWPATGLAQFIDKGEYVEVKKGTTLCPSTALGALSGFVNRNRVFWRVTSRSRANGTQSITALTRESVYDRKSGETAIVETRYDEDYATFFKRVPLHKELLVMISPQDGGSQATVEICLKGK